MARYISVPTEVEASEVVESDKRTYCKETMTMAVVLRDGRIARVALIDQPRVGDFFIFEDDNSYGGYVCKRKVFLRKYRAAA